MPRPELHCFRVAPNEGLRASAIGADRFSRLVMGCFFPQKCVLPHIALARDGKILAPAIIRSK